MKLEFHNPAGRTEARTAHAPRLHTLAGKRIGFLSNADWQAARVLALLASHLGADFVDTELFPTDAFPSGTDFIATDATIETVKNSGVDAVIIGNAACGACSTACGLAAARLEALGIPTVTITREEFVDVVRNAASGVGLPPDMPMVTFPIDLFKPDSDLSTITARRKEILDALLTWTPTALENEEAAMLTVEGRDHEDAVQKANHRFLISRCGDGLPLWPPTPGRVDWMLRGTDLPRHHVLGKVPPRGGLATVEACAIALAMAGGRPEYLCVLLAAVDALLDPQGNAALLQATSAGTFPVVIVNGPISKDIRLNSGFGCLGPDAQYPAGASIGRALRQLQQNLGGAHPGVGTMAPWGAMRFTNAVFAEDEEGLPDGWLPHNTERHGFKVGTDSISFFWATGATNIVRRGTGEQTLEQDVEEGLRRVAAFLCAPHLHYVNGYSNGTPGAILLTRVVADYLAKTGWDKAKTRQFLWERSMLSQDLLTQTGARAWIGRTADPQARENLALDRWPIASSPDNLILAVAGGRHPTHAFWLQGTGPQVLGRVVAKPRAFDELLFRANADLGCSSDACMI